MSWDVNGVPGRWVAGGLGVAGLLLLSLGGGSPAAADEETVAVLVAPDGLPAGVPVTRAMLASRDVPAAVGTRRLVPSAAAAVVLGKAPARAIPAGELLLRDDFRDGRSGLAARVPSGRVAVALAVDAVSGVAGRLVVGDVISVIPRGAEAPQLLLEVMALGHPGDAPAAYRTVVVAATGAEAAALAGWAEVGPVAVVLRGHGDRP